MSTSTQSQQDIFNSYFPKATSLNNTTVDGMGLEIVDSITANVDTTISGNIPKQTAKDNADVEKFTDRLSALLDDTFEDDWGYLTMEEPTGIDPENTKLPCVTFDVVHREPSKKKKGIKSRLTEITIDPTDDNYSLIISRQWFDYIIEFMFFDKTNRGSRILMGRIETFLETYKGFFKEQGISEIVFQEEVDSRLSKKFKDHIPSTCLRYFLLMERISVQRVRTTKEIRSKIQATQSGSTTEQGLNLISQL